MINYDFLNLITDFFVSIFSNIWTIGLQGIFAGILILFFSERIKIANSRNVNANQAKLLLVGIQDHQFIWNNLSILINQIKADNYQSNFNESDFIQCWSNILLGNNFTDKNYEFWKNLSALNNVENVIEQWKNSQSYYLNMNTEKFEIVHKYITQTLKMTRYLFNPRILLHKENASKNFFALSLASGLVALVFLSMVREAEKSWYHIYLSIPFKNDYEKQYLELLAIVKQNQCNYIDKTTKPE